MTAFFVTGTDTGVGKTRVSAALLNGLHRTGHARVVGMKPVAAGCEWLTFEDAQGAAQGHWLNEDVAALRAAGTLAVPPVFDNPYALPDALSPHLAARRAGEVIDLDHIEASFHALRQHADAVVVEGAGGFIVPLTEPDPFTGEGSWTTSADLAMRLGLPVILVVGMRLGCLNHALLTQEAIAARGLKLAGWVANHIDPGMAAQDENVATLRARLGAPMIARLPWMPDRAASAVADDFRLDLLR